MYEDQKIKEIGYMLRRKGWYDEMKEDPPFPESHEGTWQYRWFQGTNIMPPEIDDV
jgi:hypothetical protein